MGNRFKSTATIIFFLFLHSVSCIAQQHSDSPPSAPAILIEAGDMIEVTVFGQSDLSGRFRVDEKGEVYVPLLGAVPAAGLTASGFAADLDQRYVKAEILNADRAYVTVFISEYATQGIVVNGEVKVPGVYPALGVRMLNDVLTAAGGLTPNANSRVVITHKTDPANPVTVEYNSGTLPPVLPPIQIMPGDTVTVPIAGSIYVLGSIARSGIYLLEDRHVLTVEKVLAISGGLTHGANDTHSHIVRTLENGERIDILLNISHILKGRAPDIVLKDGDILYVPTNNTKLAVLQAVNSIIGVGTTVLTYRAAYQ